MQTWLFGCVSVTLLGGPGRYPYRERIRLLARMLAYPLTSWSQRLADSTSRNTSTRAPTSSVKLCATHSVMETAGTLMATLVAALVSAIRQPDDRGIPEHRRTK